MLCDEWSTSSHLGVGEEKERWTDGKNKRRIGDTVKRGMGDGNMGMRGQSNKCKPSSGRWSRASNHSKDLSKHNREIQGTLTLVSWKQGEHLL